MSLMRIAHVELWHSGEGKRLHGDEHKSATRWRALLALMKTRSAAVIVALGLLLAGPSAEAAIALDATTNGGRAVQPTLTFSHTCTGNNLILWVQVSSDTGRDDVTGVTYNGVALTQAGKVKGLNYYTYLYYLVGPSTGAHDVVVSGTDGTIYATAASYTGASQTGQPVATTIGTSMSSPLTLTLKVVAENSWLVMSAETDGNLAASTGAHQRLQNPNGFFGLFDSNGPLSAGPQFMSVVIGPTFAGAGVLASFAPDTGGGGGVSDAGGGGGGGAPDTGGGGGGAGSVGRSLARGYTSRASGFDLSFNDTVGEASSADVNLCDGHGDSSSTVGEDIDSNGTNDRQVYVDLTSGTDSPSCGLPGSPCKTIMDAMNGANSSVSGGPIQAPWAFQIQAICVKGTGRETVTFTQSGAPGTHTVPQTGSQARSFKHPRFPFILSGWDANNNDDYPPHDTGDTAVFDGDAGDTSLDLALDNPNGLSNLEIAHLTINDYGLTCPATGGAVKIAQWGGHPTQIYYHDVELNNILKGCGNSSNVIVFNFFGRSSVYSYVDLSNIQSLDNGGGYFARGSAGGPSDIAGPLRFQNISFRLFGAAGDATEGFKLWDYIDGIEILDSYMDANPAAWRPWAVGGLPTFAIGLFICSQGWTIRNNFMLDFKDFISAQGGYDPQNGFCASRTLDNVVIDGNIMRNTYEPWLYGDVGIGLLPGLDPVATVGNITITNNFLSSSTGWEACIWSIAGNPVGPQPGTVTISGNTCYGPINRHGAIVIGNPEAEGPQAAFPQQHYVITDNIIAGTQGRYPNIFTLYDVTGMVIDRNVYDPQSRFVWNNQSLTLSGWRTASGGDQSSNQCVPAFVDAAAGDFRLATTDGCAAAVGAPGVTASPFAQPSSPQSPGAVVTIGSVTLRLNMRREEVLALLAPSYHVSLTDGLIVTKTGPPFEVVGSVGFSSTGLLTYINRDWSPSDQSPGVPTAEALFNALTQISKPVAAPSGAQTGLQMCQCSVFIYESPSPRGIVKHIEVFDGMKTVSLQIVRDDAFPGGAVIVGERIGDPTK